MRSDGEALKSRAQTLPASLSTPSVRHYAKLRLVLVCVTLFATSTALALLNTARGTPNLSLNDVGHALTQPDPENSAHFLVRQLRLPRVLLGFFCGAALGLAGALLQDSLRNPLADPGLLGIAQGASLVVALAVIYPELIPPLPRPLLCLIAGVMAGSAVLLLSGTVRSTTRVVLVGAIMSGFFGVLTTAVLLLAPYERSSGLGGYFRFVTGSVSTAEWSQLNMVWPWLLIGLPAALLSGRMLNLLRLGDELASGAGLNPQRTRFLLMLLAVVLIAPVTATVGPVAFVALFAPHLARGLLHTSDARQILTVSALGGALLLLAADTLGRLLLFPTEIPAGVWTVLVIGPAAIYLVGRMTLGGSA